MNIKLKAYTRPQTELCLEKFCENFALMSSQFPNVNLKREAISSTELTIP